MNLAYVIAKLWNGLRKIYIYRAEKFSFGLKNHDIGLQNER